MSVSGCWVQPLGKDVYKRQLLLSAAMLSFAATEVVGGNGFLSVYIAAVIIGNCKIKYKYCLLYTSLRNPDLKVPHLRGVVEGKHGITFEEAKRFLKPEPIISSIQKGSVV